MNKTKIDEKKLLANANRWFEHKHNATPADCGLNFIKIWYCPRGFSKKTPSVTFAPSEEIGTAFIKERTACLRALNSLYWIGPFFAIFLFSLFWGIWYGTGESVFNISVAFCGISIILCARSCYIGRKCKKLEKIHQWQVETYQT